MTNMNKLSKHIIIAIITITTIAGCIYAGNVERNDAVLSGMSMEKYQYITTGSAGGLPPPMW